MSQKIKEYIQYIDEVIKTLKSTPIETADLQAIKSNLENKSYLIPIIGEFSSGKSSLINKVISSDILPVAITTETEIPIELKYSNTPYIIAQTSELKEERFSINEWEKIKSNAKEYLAFEMYLDNSNVQELMPFTLVDMPSFNTNLGEFKKFYDHYIQQGDYFIIAVSTEKGTLSPELINLLQKIKNDDKFFTVLVTKTDLKTVAENNEILNHITDLVDIEFGPGFDVKLLQKEQIKNSIQKLFNNKSEQIVQTAFLRPLKDITQSLVGQLNVVKNALTQDNSENQNTIESLTEELEKLERSYKKLQSDTQYFDAEKTARLIGRQTSKKLIQETDNFAALIGEDDGQIINQIMQISQTVLKETLLEELEATNEEVTKNFAIHISKITDSFDISERRNLSSLLKSTYSNGTLGGVFSLLPTAVKGLVQGYQSDQFKLNFTQNIVPEITKDIQNQLTPLIDKEFQYSTTQLLENLRNGIEQKKTAISQLESDKNNSGKNNEQVLVNLNDARSKIYQLAEKTLYQGN